MAPGEVHPELAFDGRGGNGLQMAKMACSVWCLNIDKHWFEWWPMIGKIWK